MRNPLSGVILLIVLILLCAPDRALVDADSGWHIMAGKYITETHTIPHENVFSYTSGDYQWFNISWLWDVLLNLVYTSGGLYAAVIFSLALVLFTFLIVTDSCLKRGGSIVGTAEIFIAASFPLVATALVRPQIVTYLFTAITLALYYLVKTRSQLWPLLIVPFIVILWANMHGGFVVGLSIILAFTLELLLQRGFAHRFALIAACVLSLICVLINPLGIHIIDAVARSFSGPIAAMIDEWKMPRDPVDYLYILLFLAVFIFRRRNFSMAEILLSFFWLVQSLLAVRNLPIFFIVSAPALSAGLHQFVLTRSNIAEKDTEYRASFKMQYLILSIVLALGISAGFGQKLTRFSVDKLPNYPAQEVAYILANYPEIKFFNNYDIGGFVILASDGKVKTFIDGRAETAFPPQVIADYIAFHNDQNGWRQIRDKYQVGGILLAKYHKRQIAELDSDPAWQQVFAGNKAVVYIRRQRLKKKSS